MKSKWVATLNAGNLKAGFLLGKNLCLLLLMSLLLISNSCDKSDDLETIVNELPPANESPIKDESIIIYTDIEPDFISDNLKDDYNLDLNNDQIIDFTVRSDSSEDWEFLVIASNTITENGIISVSPWYTYAVPLNSGKEIFNLSGYRNGESYSTWGILYECYTVEQNCSYSWENKVGEYLGLKFIINGQTHYGWAQLNVTSVTQWVIMDYAYNATPNKPILAGQRK